jgi:hypothetical protein
MSRLAILALRILLVLVVIGLVCAQVIIIPIASLEFGEAFGSGAVGTFYTVVGIALVVCVEVALVAIWLLLSMVSRDAIFSRRAFRWVDVIIGAGLAATALAIAVAVHMYFVIEPRLDAPGLIVLAGTGVLGAASFVALMIVMRGLLRSATALQGELAEVV